MLVLMRIVVTLLADAGSKISSCQQSVDSTSLEDGVRWLIRVTVVERTTPNRKKTHPPPEICCVIYNESDVG